MTRTRNTNPNKVFRRPTHKGITVTISALLIIVAALAYPAGYGVGVLLPHRLAGGRR
nr:MAG TPA_asm: hypothetical protein [Caudoviricetes sp.]